MDSLLGRAKYEIVTVPSFGPGDLNCSGGVDTNDIGPFVLALLDPAGYAAEYPSCDLDLADLNEDGSADGLDIQLFVNVLIGM